MTSDRKLEHCIETLIRIYEFDKGPAKTAAQDTLSLIGEIEYIGGKTTLKCGTPNMVSDDKLQGN